MAEAICRSERLQKKREAAGRSRHESDQSESDQEEISFNSKRAQPSGSKANKSHRRALFEDDEVLSVFGRLSMTSDQANDSQEKESASDSDGQSTTSSQSRVKTKAQINYEEALRAYHDAKYEAPRVREELDRRLRLAAAALASERTAQSSSSKKTAIKTTPVARPRAVNENQTAEKSTEQDDTVDEFLTSMRERFRSMINDSQSPPRSANVALVNPPSSSKQAVAVVMNKVTASQASVPVNMPVSSAVLSMATSISSTTMITTSVVSLPVMTAVTTTTSSLPVTAVIGLTSTPIPARVQVEEELERRLAEAEEKIRVAEAAERRAMAAEKLVKEAEAKFLSIEIASEILSVSERQSNKSRIRSREAEQGSELTSAASEVRKAIRGNPNLTTVDNIALFSTSDNRKEAHVKKQSNGTVEKMSAGMKSKQLPPVKQTEKKKPKARMTRVEEEISEISDDESKLESASRVGRSSKKIQSSRSRSPSSPKRRVRVQETSSESEKSVASAGRKERKNIKLPVYSGDSFLDQFLLQFRNCAELSRWPKEEWGKRLIPCLEGRGRAVLTKKLMSGNPSYGKIVRALRLRFGGEDDPSTWRSALKRRERREKESLTDLAFWISDYLDKAYTEGSDMDPVFAVDLFIDALTDSQQRLHVECGKPANLQEALHLAQVWESAHRSESARQYRHSKPVRARQITTGDTDAEQSCSDVRVVHEKEKKSGQKKKEKARKGNNKGRESQVKNEASQSRVQETAAQGDWMRAIEECKAEIRELKLQQPVVKNDVVPQGRGGYSGQPNRGVLNANAQPFHPVAPYRYAQPQMQRGCFICHAPDHFKRECPYYQAPPAQQQQVGNGQSRWTADQAHGQSQNRQ